MNKLIIFSLPVLLSAATAMATPPLECQGVAESMVKKVLTVQEQASVSVETIAAREDRSGPETVQVFDIQGYKVNAKTGAKTQVRVPSRVVLLPESSSCALFSYSLPTAN